MAPLRSIALIVVLGALTALGSPVPASTAVGPNTPTLSVPATTAPTVRPARPVHRERFVVTGLVPDHARRPVVLQRRTPAGWRRSAVATTGPRGRYTFDRTATKLSVTLRVFAPATTSKKAWTSRPRLVQSVPDRAFLSLTGSITATNVTATVRPIRAGRKVSLRFLRNGVWQPIGAANASDSAGQTQWQLPVLPTTARSYRVWVERWNGAPGFAGPTVVFTPAVPDRTLPAMNLTTTDSAPIVTKEDYVTGTLSIDGEAPRAMEIRGRGNSTWTFPKKPYRIKLGASASLLDLPADRDWALLANFADRSTLRTSVAFAFAEATGLPWTPKSAFVDVTLNGTDLGTYQLTEHVEAKASKVVLAEGGLLLEIDERFEENGDPGFRSGRDIPIAFKDPDNPTPEQQAAVSAAVTTLEERLYAENWTDPVLGYAPLVDLDSFVDWYLVNEVMKNLDAGFFSSVFMTWTPDGTFAMSNVWDFDLSAGFDPGTLPPTAPGPTEWWLRGGLAPVPSHPHHSDNWLQRMTGDPAFQSAVAARWATLEPLFATIVAGIDERAADLGNSAIVDWSLWRFEHAPVTGTDHGASPGAEAQFLQDWLEVRLDWISAAVS